MRQATDNQLMVLYDYICQDCTYTVRSTGAYILFSQGGPIDHCTHVPGLVAQYSAEIEYNSARTTGMDLEHFRMLNKELSNKDPYVVT